MSASTSTLCPPARRWREILTKTTTKGRTANRPHQQNWLLWDQKQRNHHPKNHGYFHEILKPNPPKVLLLHRLDKGEAVHPVWKAKVNCIQRASLHSHSNIRIALRLCNTSQRLPPPPPSTPLPPWYQYNFMTTVDCTQQNGKIKFFFLKANCHEKRIGSACPRSIVQHRFFQPQHVLLSTTLTKCL